MSGNYNPKDEIKVDLNGKIVQNYVALARTEFMRFGDVWANGLDLAKPETISRAYEDATKRGVFDFAQSMRELIYGKDMHFYGVVYLWDACPGGCIYCPASVTNVKKAEEKGTPYKPRELTIEQAIEDTLAVMKDGHTHMCYLSGSAPGRDALPDKLVPYLTEFDKLGLDEIILNVEPATEEGFGKMRAAVKKTPLQFRVFQETYDRDAYAKVHPCGPKADYDFRRQSQARAIKSGFDNVGLGVLFGLHRYPIEEIKALAEHASKLSWMHGVRPARVCLPSANELANIGVTVPYLLERGAYTNNTQTLIASSDYEKFNELTYALARLAMPEINIVSSERDCPAMLKILDKYATCTTLNVHPGVGENAKIFPKNGTAHFEQATVFPRDPKTTVAEMKSRGYNPIIAPP